jgi:hypothetical protein
MKTISALFAIALLALAACSTPQTTTTTTATTTQSNRQVKMVNGKPYVLVAGELGSNIPGRWVPEDSPDAQAAGSTGSMDRSTFQKMQNSSQSMPAGN